MNPCPDCKNDLVCHDQGECLRPTPETDAFYAKLYSPKVPARMIEIACGDERRKMQSFERQRNEAREYAKDLTDKYLEASGSLQRQLAEAREQLASEKATRNAIIAKGIETERQLAEARQAFAIATDQLVQVQSELRQAREENAKLREALANATCLILAVGEPKETAGHQHGWYEARKIVLEQVNKLTP